MRRCWILGLLMFLAGQGPVRAQDEVLDAAMFSSGAAAEEDTDPDWMERLEGLRIHPLRINGASRGRLLSSGILSPYQVASLEDYRKTSGDILSSSELALVDGFNSAWVKMYLPYLSFESARRPGSLDTVRVRQTALFRGTTDSYGGKYKVIGNHFQGAAAWRPGGGSGHLLLEGRRSRLLIGDFQVRYGQGVAHWSGFTMNSLSSLQAFSRRSTGLTPVCSFSGSGAHRGAALDMGYRHVGCAIFADRKGFFGAHAEWLFHSGQVGASVFLEKQIRVYSFDARVNIRGMDLFAEIAMKSGTTAGKGGLLFPLGEHFRSAWQIRALPSHFTGKKYGEYGLASGLEYMLRGRHAVSWTVDASLLPSPVAESHRSQIRTVLSWDCDFHPAWRLSIRLQERYRSYEPTRTEGRADIKCERGFLQSAFRLHASYVRLPGFLAYWEGGLKTTQWTAFLRLTGIHIRTWSDRIWCYERDAPGNFSVPAYYGTGGAVSLYGGWKHRFRWGTFRGYLRAEGLWRKEKPGRTGLKVQLMLER